MVVSPYIFTSPSIFRTATFKIVVSSYSVNEGSSLTVTVNDPRLNNGLYYYTVDSAVGTVNADDISLPGSISFTGSQYLTFTANNNFLFGAGDFTVEAWVYPTANNRGIMNNWNSGGEFQLSINSSNRLVFAFTDAASGTSTKTMTGASTSITLNSWNHVAISRKGSTIKMFVNGVADTTVFTSPTNFSGTLYYQNGTAKDLYIGIGADLTGYFNGYITGVRILKGTGLYSNNFATNTQPDTQTNVVLLLKALTAATLTVDSSVNNYSSSTTGTISWNSSTPANYANGGFDIINGSGTFVINLGTNYTPPYSGEGTEGIRVRVRKNSITGPVVAASGIVSIKDIFTASPVGQQIFTTLGDTNWTVPAGVYRIHAVAVGGGGGGSGVAAGSGGNLRYANNIAVTPGEVLSVRVAAGGVTNGNSNSGWGGSSWIRRSNTALLSAGGGRPTGIVNNANSGAGDNTLAPYNPYGIAAGDGGGLGGSGVNTNGGFYTGGGGAGGYTGNGGDGGNAGGSGLNGAGGGGGGGGSTAAAPARGGGGVGLTGQGLNGSGSTSGGGGGSGGSTAGTSGAGATYGGGGGHGTSTTGRDGGQGAVRIIWGSGRVYPSTNTSDDTTLLTSTFIVTPDVVTTNEGASVNFSIETTNVPDGTILYWTAETNTGTINSSDVSALNGFFSITSGIGSFVVNVTNDFTTEGAESFVVVLRTNSITGTIRAASVGITIVDTSIDPVATVTPSTSTIVEDYTVSFAVSMTPAVTGTYYWTTNTVSGTINASDFNDSVTSGSFTVTAGSGSISRTLTFDGTAEASDAFTISVRRDSISGSVLGTSSTVSVQDMSATITPSVSSVNEGSSVIFTVSSNVANGTTLYWTIDAVSGTVNAADFTTSLSGNFVYPTTTTVTATLSNDLTTEGTETFSFNIRKGSTSGTIIGTSPTITINDTSKITATVTPSVSSVNEGNSVTFSVNTSPSVTGTYYWSTNVVTGTINAADFSDGNLTGSFTITGGAGNISRTLVADLTTEGTEEFTISVRTDSTTGPILGTSSTVTVADTSAYSPTVVVGTKLPIFGSAAGDPATISAAGWTQIVSTSGDDQSLSLSGVTFNPLIYGTAINLFASSNTYITSASTTVATTSFTSPPQRTIHIGSADNSWQRVWVKYETNATRIRYEGRAATGGTPGVPNIVYEATFYRPTPTNQYIEICIGVHNRTARTILTGASSSGTTVTVSSTVGLKADSVLKVTSGTGQINAGTYITAIINSTSFSLNVAPAVALSGATIEISAINGVFGFTNGTGTFVNGRAFPIDSIVSTLNYINRSYVIETDQNGNSPTITIDRYITT